MTLFIDKNGDELPLGEWATLIGDSDYRHLAKQKVGKYLVSTIWEGIDMMPISLGLYSTVVFEGNEAVKVLYHSRTVEEAMLTHERTVAEVRDGRV